MMLQVARKVTRSMAKTQMAARAFSAVGEMDVDAVVKSRKKNMSKTYDSFQTFKDPVVLERAEGQYCYGPDGQKYLDLLAHNLTISVGHGHPKVRAAAKEQIDKMPHTSSMYYSEAASQLAEKLVDTFPERTDGEKWQALFAVTGTEAVELALQMARVVTGNIPILSLTNSYHGSYGTAMAASGGKACRHDLPETGGIFHLQSPIYHHKDNIDGLVEMAETTIGSSTSGNIGAFLFEPLQGYGGIHELPHEYINKMAKLTREHGGLVIADEIQTGYGRMGDCFWAYEASGVEPDLVIVAKGLGCGFPISAVVAKESVFKTFDDTGKFVFSTYGANPVCAAAACAVLDVLKEEKFQERAFKLGQVVSKHLHNIMDTFEDCIEVRGKGLMWGIELEPDVAVTVFESLKDQNFLVGLGGARKNVLRVMPPMCLTEEDLDHFHSVLYATMETCSAKK
eukprot:CAMPEP_0195517046 /NCGR_PEP_ID=MMETSP0794_2-20130614/9530_1 /TAXON_ID=515487 /ORGANISM="Stephanopyxis turris, Strain CCMP 815" /LENGTH=452 /DNA_ID=CAMNT_0040645787 /DNA_START=74 /DNA_END=1432 /DNA_ORIENTATION=-